MIRPMVVPRAMMTMVMWIVMVMLVMIDGDGGCSYEVDTKRNVTGAIKQHIWRVQ